MKSISEHIELNESLKKRFKKISDDVLDIIDSGLENIKNYTQNQAVKNQVDDKDEILQYISDTQRDLIETDKMLAPYPRIVDKFFKKINKKAKSGKYKNTLQVRYELDRTLTDLYVEIYKALNNNSMKKLDKETLVRLIDIHPLIDPFVDKPTKMEKDKLINLINKGEIKSLFDLRAKYTK